MALNGQPGDIEFLRDWRVFLRIPVIAVLYKHPTNIKGLQFMAKSSRLGAETGGVTYRVLVAPVGQHVENLKLPGVEELTKQAALLAPLLVKEFAAVLTNGDPDLLFTELAGIQANIRLRFGISL